MATLRVVYCPLCGSGNTMFFGYDDGYYGGKFIGIGEVWVCDGCSHLFEIGEAEEEWDSSFDIDERGE